MQAFAQQGFASLCFGTAARTGRSAVCQKSLKPTPNWDGWGCSGIPGRGQGSGDLAIDHRRERPSTQQANTGLAGGPAVPQEYGNRGMRAKPG